MGVWIKSGSRCESAELNGISHFVEHMLFKGTKSRSAQRIAREMDSIGGNLDAFTSKETICFNVKSLSDHVPIALDVLTDMVLNPTFALPDIERERGVILEEIKIDEDNPDVLVHELFTQSFWKGHPLGKPILGTTETVGRFGQQQLFAYHGDRFHGGKYGVLRGGQPGPRSVCGSRGGEAFRARRRRGAARALRARAERSHYSAQQKGAGAGADLPGSSRAEGYG